MDAYTRSIVVKSHQRDRQAEAREARLARIASSTHTARRGRPSPMPVRGHLRPLALGFLLSFGVLVGAVAASSDGDTGSAAPAAAEQAKKRSGGSGGGGPAAMQPQ